MKDLHSTITFEKLEKYWRDFVLVFPWATDLKNAVMASYPALPYYEPNHLANINAVNEVAENLLQMVVNHFETTGVPAFWVRVSPLNRPESLSLLLEREGFRQDFETSVMIFKSRRLKNSVTIKPRIEEISKSEMDRWKELVCTIFGVPPEWNAGFDTYVDAYVEAGGRCYIAYLDEKPIGTCSLLSMNGSGGIFTIGTREEQRRRGVGTALTLYALNDSIREGDTLHFLYVDKGDYAERLYKKIGFEVHHTVKWFVKEL